MFWTAKQGNLFLCDRLLFLNLVKAILDGALLRKSTSTLKGRGTTCRISQAKEKQKLLFLPFNRIWGNLMNTEMGLWSSVFLCPGSVLWSLVLIL